MKTGFALNEDVSAVRLASLWKELAGGLAGVQAGLWVASALGGRSALPGMEWRRG